MKVDKAGMRNFYLFEHVMIVLPRFLANQNSQVSTQSRENCPEPFLGFGYHSTDPYELNNLTESLSH